MKNQSAESIERRASKLRGRKISDEHKLKISLALKAKGRKLSPESRAKAIRTLLRPKNLTPEQEKRRRESIRKSKIGCHNYGRAARDRPDHFRAIHWMIRNPRGVIYEFDNLQSWCRKNEWIFLPDKRPMSKTPLWKRAVYGFNNQIRTDRKAQTHWNGWTLVSVLERKVQGAPDILDRDVISETRQQQQKPQAAAQPEGEGECQV